MSATGRHITAHGLPLRLCRSTVPQQYWVRISPSDRSLGVVYRIKSRWTWATSRAAYRGDGRPGHLSDGLDDKVPDHLDAAGSEKTLQLACEQLINHLDRTQAPALGYGPHQDVRRPQLCPVVSSLF
jgi:hypothetical protein